MNAVTVRNLSKYYGKSLGIKSVSFDVKEGDFFGFIGPNGAGKSTTIRILMGLISRFGGEAMLFGNDVSKNKSRLYSDIGYMPSEPLFYGNMRVGELLKLSARLRKADCDKEAKLLCERLKLDTSKRISQLSLGNRKKVSIVCAMQHNPKLYILDEPTSGLDPLMQHVFYSLLEEKNKAGATILLSSHILIEVQKYCKNAAIIRNGSILVSDSIENLGRTEAKRVSLKCNSVFDESLYKCRSIKDFSKSGDCLSFLYMGSPNDLISTLSEVDVEDLSITEPDLDEVFMHYYSSDGSERKSL